MDKAQMRERSVTTLLASFFSKNFIKHVTFSTATFIGTSLVLHGFDVPLASGSQWLLVAAAFLGGNLYRGVLERRSAKPEEIEEPPTQREILWGRKESRQWIREAKVVPIIPSDPGRVMCFGLDRVPKMPFAIPQPPPGIYQAKGVVKCDWADMGRLAKYQTAQCVKLMDLDAECANCEIGKTIKKAKDQYGLMIRHHVSDPVGGRTWIRSPGEVFMRDGKLWVWTGRGWKSCLLPRRRVDSDIPEHPGRKYYYGGP